MDPFSMILGLGSLAGGLFSSSKGQRKPLNPGMLRDLWGPQAQAQDTQSFYRMLLNSPAFSQMMSSTAAQGNRIGGSMRANLARRGVSSSGIGAFQQAASRGYGSSLQRQGQMDLFNQAMQLAGQNNANRMNLWGQSMLQQQQTPSMGQMIGGSLFNAGAGFLSRSSTPNKPPVIPGGPQQGFTYG